MRELDIRVTVQGADKAKQALAAVDREVDTLTKRFQAGDLTTAQYDQRLKILSQTETEAREKTAQLDRAVGGLSTTARAAEGPVTALRVAVGVLAADLVLKAARSAIVFGKEALLTSARVETLGSVAQFLGQQSGHTAGEIDALVAALVRQGITTGQANDTVIQLTRANLGLADATQLATVAQSLARATGENSSETLGRLIHGVQTLSPLMLRHAGVVIQLDQEYKEFAAAAGRTVESLSGQEKQQIALAAVLREGDRVMGVYGVTNESVGGKLQSMARHQEEASRAIGDVFKPALVLAVDVLTWFLQLVQRAPALFGTLGVVTISLAGAFTIFKGAAALGIISTTAMTTALGLLWPAVAVGATAFAAWKLGAWIGEITRATDAVEWLTGRLMGLSTAEIMATRTAREYAQSAQGQADVAAKQAQALETLEANARATTEASLALTLADAAAEQAALEHAEAMKKVAAALVKLNASVMPLEASLKLAHNQVVQGISAYERATVAARAVEGATVGIDAATQRLIPGLITVNGRLADLEQAGFPAAQTLYAIGEGATHAASGTRGLGDSFKSLFSGDFKAVFGDIGGFFKGGIKDIGKGVLEGLGSNILNAGLGLAMQGVKALGGAIADLFTGGEAARVRDLTGEVIRAAGGFDQLAVKIHAATGSQELFQALLDADTEAEYRKALEGINGALDQLAARLEALRGVAQDTAAKMGDLLSISPGLQAALDDVYNAQTPQEYADAMARVNDEVDEAISKQRAADAAFEALGFTFAQLPKTVRDQRLGAEFDQWGKHIDAAVDAGADLNFTIGKAGPELSRMVNIAATTGTEIPAHMRPVLEQAIVLGVLFDANGKKITDLSQAGVVFGDTYKDNATAVASAMDLVVEALERIIARLEALDGTTVDYTVRENYQAGERQRRGDTEGSTNADVLHTGGMIGAAAMTRILPFVPRAHRGLAVDERLIVAQTGEGILSRAGMQRVGGAEGLNALNQGGGRSLAPTDRLGGASLSTAALEAKVDELSATLTRQQQQQPYLIASAITSALQKARLRAA